MAHSPIAVILCHPKAEVVFNWMNCTCLKLIRPTTKKTKCCETMDAPLRKVVVLIGHNGLFSINVLESARYLLILVETINDAQQE